MNDDKIVRANVVRLGGNPWWGLLVGIVFLIFIAWSLYSACVVNVPARQIAVLTHKTGTDLANDEELATLPEQKGIQLQFLTEGRHFLDPYHWSWKLEPHVEVPVGKLGVQVRLFGDDLPYGEFLASNDSHKGILSDVLRPGRYPINPYAYKIELHEPVTIEAGFRGVVTNLAGPVSADPNRILVEKGSRGVQEETLEAGTFYVNPYVTRISPVDCRSQRINLAEEKDLGFPSRDGFWVMLDGIVEFRIKAERAAEVFVLYNESVNGDRIDEEIRNKVILPNARAFCRLEGSNTLGRELISGDTRTKFQENFQREMRQACDPLGIEVIQALLTRIRPPEKIADPVRQREIAKQKQKQFVQETLQQQSERELAIQKELVNQKRALVKADQEVIRLTTEAMRAQEVALTKARELQAVARFKLQAAQDEAAAIESRGKAAADVVLFENSAIAAGWKESVAAFNGDGIQLARYTLFQKLAPSYRQIMANTADSPMMDIFRSFTTGAPAPKTGR